MPAKILPEIKTRPALVKALDAAGIKGYEISGAGKSLSVRFPDKYYNKFMKKVANNWDGLGNMTTWRFNKTATYRPGSEFDPMSPYSYHQY